MTYLLMIIGLTLLLLGANYLVDSSVAIAQRAKISNFIIGLTIVGMGTSSPELFISVSSALKGMGDVAIGNVIGSNICNTMLILGITALISPIAIERSNLRRDIPLGVLTSILLCILCYIPLFMGNDHAQLNMIAGITLLGCFALFMLRVIIKERKEKAEETYEDPSANKLSRFPIWTLIIMAVASLIGLLYGGNLFLNSAIEVAQSLGMSNSVIAITIIAVGTSLPELITCIVASLKSNQQLALGNVFGSNIFNILLILGISATISPLTLQGINLIDFSVLIGAAIFIYIFAFTLRKNVIDRAEGAFFLLAYIAYTAYLIIR